MNIRFGTQADVELIREDLRGSWINHVDHDPEFINRAIVENTTLDEYFKSCFDGSDTSFLLIAEIDQQLAGFAKVDIKEIEKFYNETKILYIDDLYTVEQFRGKGVAKFLLAEVEKLAKDKGIKWLKGRVYSWNKPSQRTVESAGFKNMYSEWFKIIG